MSISGFGAGRPAISLSTESSAAPPGAAERCGGGRGVVTKFDVTLGSADLARVRFAVSPMQHLLFGLQGDTPSSDRWLRRVGRHLPGSARGFVELATAHPSLYIPDFLSPAIPRPAVGGRSAIDDELDAIRAVSAGQLGDELRMYDRMRPPPRLALELRDGGTRALTRLTEGIRDLYRACLAEDWPDISRRLNTDIGRRVAFMGEEGAAAMLAGLHPTMRDIAGLHLEVEVHAQGTISPWESYTSPGHGILIAPNLFLDGYLSPSLSPWQAPQFAYTASHAPAPDSAKRRHRDALAALLGRGRAGVLRAVGSGCTTAELAKRLQVSAPTASVQAAALREAGLIATSRDGRQVRHTLTSIGVALLEANPEP